MFLLFEKLQRWISAFPRSRNRCAPQSASERISLCIEQLEGREVPSHAVSSNILLPVTTHDVVVPAVHQESAPVLESHDREALASPETHHGTVSIPSHTIVHALPPPVPAPHAPAATPEPRRIPPPIAKPAPAPTPAPPGYLDPGGRVNVGPAPAPSTPPVSGYRGPIEGSSPAFNPTTYVPTLCKTATFSGTMGTDGYYSSFTIVGHNPATGTTVIVGYVSGNNGSPWYKWSVSVETNPGTWGNGSWGSVAVVYQPYYQLGLPIAITYQQPPHGP
jgi:hypothetical protein